MHVISDAPFTLLPCQLSATYSLNVILCLHSGNTWHVVCIYAVVQVSFSPQNYTVSEGSSVELIIVLDQPACQNTSVTVTTMDGTAMGECLY